MKSLILQQKHRYKQQQQGKKIIFPRLKEYYGHERLRNGNMKSWKDDDPHQWIVDNQSVPNRYVTQVDNACQLYTDGSGYIGIYEINATEVGKIFEFSIDIEDVTTLKIRVGDGDTWYGTFDSEGVGQKLRFVATGTTFYIQSFGANATDVTFTNTSVREIRTTPIFNDNPSFEDGTFLNQWQLSGNNSDDAVIELVTSPTLSGTYALKMQHQLPGIAGYNRAQIITKPTTLGEFIWGREYWIGIRYYLENWLTDPAEWNVLLGAHAVPQWNIWGEGGESGFGIWTDHTGKLYIYSQVIEDPMNEIPGIGGITNPPAFTTALLENQILDFVVNVKLSCYEADNPFIKWWYQGTQVVDLSGPNVHYHDADGNVREQYNTLQVGSYKDPAETQLRRLFVDRIKIAGDQAIYADVVPLSA